MKASEVDKITVPRKVLRQLFCMVQKELYGVILSPQTRKKKRNATIEANANTGFYVQTLSQLSGCDLNICLCNNEVCANDGINNAKYSADEIP